MSGLKFAKCTPDDRDRKCQMYPSSGRCPPKSRPIIFFFPTTVLRRGFVIKRKKKKYKQDVLPFNKCASKRLIMFMYNLRDVSAVASCEHKIVCPYWRMTPKTYPYGRTPPVPMWIEISLQIDTLLSYLNR